MKNSLKFYFYISTLPFYARSLYGYSQYSASLNLRVEICPFQRTTYKQSFYSVDSPQNLRFVQLNSGASSFSLLSSLVGSGAIPYTSGISLLYTLPLKFFLQNALIDSLSVGVCRRNILLYVDLKETKKTQVKTLEVLEFLQHVEKGFYMKVISLQFSKMFYHTSLSFYFYFNDQKVEHKEIVIEGRHKRYIKKVISVMITLPFFQFSKLSNVIKCFYLRYDSLEACLLRKKNFLFSTEYEETLCPNILNCLSIGIVANFFSPV